MTEGCALSPWTAPMVEIIRIAWPLMGLTFLLGVGFATLRQFILKGVPSE